jgi:protocatechuate 3,4-dioxygenase beta subunit
MKLSVLGLSVVCATTIIGAQRPEPRPIPNGTNAIAGRVTEAGTDVSIAGAIVTLTGYFDAAGVSPPDWPEFGDSPLALAPRAVMTTAGGEFVFRDLPAGRYSITASAFGYANNDYPRHFVDLANSAKPSLVAVRLWKYGSIAGTVVDERGEPVAGVPVSALRRTVDAGGISFRREADALSDDRGAYRIAQLSPGSYAIGALSTNVALPAAMAAEIDGTPLPGMGQTFLDLLRAGIEVPVADGVRIGDSMLLRQGPAVAIAPDGRRLMYSNTFSPGTDNPEDATVISLTSGASRTNIDVPIRLSPAVSVSGTATGPNGPIGNLAIRLNPQYRLTSTTFSPVGTSSAVTDANGRFTFPAVTPGPYNLTAQLAIFSETGSIPALFATQSLTVADKDLSGLAVMLRPGIHVSGRVEFTGANATVISNSQPFVFSLQPVGTDLWRTLPVRITSGDTFTTAGDPPGRYVPSVNTIVGWALQSISRGARRLPDDVIELESDDITDLVLTFSKNLTRVSGSIVDPSAAADADADVIVFPADTTLWRNGVMTNRRERGMHATPAGTFQFTGLAPGAYYIAAVGARWSGDWRDPEFLESVIEGATRFTLGDGAEQRLVLKTIVPRGR